MYTYLCWMVLAIYIQTGIQVNANRVPSWAQLGVKLDQMWIHLNSSGPPWIQSNPFAAYLGPIGFQTTTININTNNRFLLPRGGLTVYIYRSYTHPGHPHRLDHMGIGVKVSQDGRWWMVDSGCRRWNRWDIGFVINQTQKQHKTNKIICMIPYVLNAKAYQTLSPQIPGKCQQKLVPEKCPPPPQKGLPNSKSTSNQQKYMNFTLRF